MHQRRRSNCRDRLLGDAFSEENIRIKEILEKFGEESIAVRSHGFLDFLEDTAVDAIGIVTGFQQIGRNTSDDHRLGHPFGPCLPI